MPRNYLSGSIKKALAIVECVGKSPKPLKASQVSIITKLDRATTFRILIYLTSLGYIFKDTSNNLYSLGHKIFEFGDKSDFLKSLTTLCFDYIKNLSIITHHITYLAVLEGPHIVYCDKVGPGGETPPRAFRMRMDAHSSALGKAILAFKTREELKDIYKSYTLHKHTKNTITSLEKLIVDLNRVKKNGYSINEAETFNYVYGIGAPIIDSKNRAIASIAISGTKGTINVRTIGELSEKVTNTAKLISEKLNQK
tara:strand:- start:265 stop:1026 length:762 start_codon:yes stop_codon:yes gene_type:complete